MYVLDNLKKNVYDLYVYKYYLISFFSIPSKINPWNGKTEYQYNLPQIPLGLKVAA
jgi:hypothetical protein